MTKDYIVFDLDGTISDPKDGIVRSMNYALAAHGFSPRDERELQRYIGPPLDLTFQSVLNTDDPKLIHSLVSKYRERYSDIGFSENKLYDGIADSLERLHRQYSLAVCTSKRKDFAERILALFQLDHLFEFVNGGDVGITKVHQLSALLSDKSVGAGSVMVGDRHVDLIAANRNGLRSVGVLWGYGSYDELSSENPAMILNCPKELSHISL